MIGPSATSWNDVFGIGVGYSSSYSGRVLEQLLDERLGLFTAAPAA
jgi:hypothetical protein